MAADFDLADSGNVADPVLIDGVAAGFLSRRGAAAVFLLLEEAEIAGLAGDDLSMIAWRDPARSGFQQLLS